MLKNIKKITNQDSKGSSACGLRTITLFIVLCSLLIVSCPDFREPSALSDNAPSLQATGVGYFLLTDTDTAGRTIYPDTPQRADFDRISLAFYSAGYDPLYIEDYNDETITLFPGEWELIVFAYKNAVDSDATLESEPKSVLIIEGETATAAFGEIELFPSDTEGDGTFIWDISAPDVTIADVSVTVTRLPPSGTAPTEQKTANGALTLNSGYYIIATVLTDDSGRTAGHNELVKIMRNLTTTYKKEFSANDFTAVLPMGLGVTIETPAAELWVNQTIETTAASLVSLGQPITYIWKSDGEAVQVGPLSTYTVRLEDRNKEISVTAYVANYGGTSSSSVTIPELIGIYNHDDQLALIGNDPDYPLNGNYILAESLDTSGTPSLANWTPIGYHEDGDLQFTGKFNGNGKTISGLTINNTSYEHVGLFSVIGAGGVVENVGLSGAVITGKDCVGGIAGTNEGTINKCYNTGGTVTGTSSVGGIAGFTTVPNPTLNSTISNCYNTSSVKGTTNTGGIVGGSYRGIIRNCYNTGRVEGETNTGGIVGSTEGDSTNASTIQYCVSLGLKAEGTTNTNRILGVIGEAGNVNFSGNYAREYMTVDPAPGTLDGTDIILSDTTYGDVFNDNGWDINLESISGSIWVYPAGINSSSEINEGDHLPILRGFDNAQNHLLPEAGKNTLSITASPSAGGEVYITIGNDPTQLSPPIQVADSMPVSITATQNPGYTFSSWTVNSGGVTPTSANTPPTPATFDMPDEDVSITANFTANTYTVTYNGNNNTGGSTAQTTHTYGVSSSLRSNGFSRTGYTFARWNTAANGSGTNYTNGQSVLNLTSAQNGNVDLYAQWTGNTYTVTYNANGGSGTMAQTTHTYGTPSALRTNSFTRAGYTFAGWSTSSGTQTVVYTNGADVSTLTSANNGNVTLYAQWTGNTYTVTFNKNHTDTSGFTEASPQTRQVTVPANTVALPATPPTRTGYVFAGWYTTTANTGGTEFTSASTVSSNTTVYARWSRVGVAIGTSTTPSNYYDTIQAALNSITTSGTYTVTIYGGNQTIAGSTTGYSVPANAKITLVGDTAERIITLSSAGRMFTVGNAGAELTLGNRITLQGRGISVNNTQPLVWVEGGGSFIMNTGSKITGHYGSIGSSAEGYRAVIWITGTGSAFTMNGGSITGNQSGSFGAVVYANSNGSIRLNGGSITGNTTSAANARADVKAGTNCSITLSGNATVDYICLYSGSDSSTSTLGNLYISNNWTGNASSKITLVLHTNTGSASTLPTPWINKKVIQAAAGHTLTTGDIAKFTPGWFYGNGSTRAEISDYCRISTDAANIGTLVESYAAQLRKKINDTPAGGTLTLTAADGGEMDETDNINKEITITTTPGANVTFTRPLPREHNSFNIGSGGKLILKPGTGGTLTLTGGPINYIEGTSTSTNETFITVRNGGELELNDGVTITDTYINGDHAIRITGAGSKFTMKGGIITGITRVGPVGIENGAAFHMSGGAITNCGNLNWTTRATVFITGTGSTFVMSGTAEISNNEVNPNTNGGGGAVRVTSGASFIMQGGTIKGNFTQYNAYGGGVLIENGGSFSKTGGIIYGMNAGAPDWNRITNNPSPANLYAGQGYAVYVAGPTVRFRDNTAGTTVNLDSSTAANWGQ